MLSLSVKCCESSLPHHKQHITVFYAEGSTCRCSSCWLPQKYIRGCFSCLFADAGFTLSSYDTRALMSSKKHRNWTKISRPSDHQQWLLLNWLSFSLISLLVVFYHIQAVSIKWVIIKFLKCYDSPNDEFHFAPASRVHQDGNQLWISRTKDAVRPNCNCEEALLLVTSLEDQLNTKNRIGYSCKRVSATSRLQL